MKTFLLILLLLPATLLADGRYGHYGYRYNYNYNYGNPNNFWGGFAAGAIIGGIAGYGIAPRYYYPPPIYAVPTPPPPPVTYVNVWDEECGCYRLVPGYP